MKASSVRKSDVLLHPETGKLIYTVQAIEGCIILGKPGVRAIWRHADGGEGDSAWLPDDETPLTRPKA